LYGIATNLVGQHRREEVRRYRMPSVGPYVGDHAAEEALAVLVEVATVG